MTNEKLSFRFPSLAGYLRGWFWIGKLKATSEQHPSKDWPALTAALNHKGGR